MADHNDSRPDIALQALIFSISNIDQIFESHLETISQSVRNFAEQRVGASNDHSDSDRKLQQDLATVRTVQLSHARLDVSCLERPNILQCYTDFCELRSRSQHNKNFVIESAFSDLLVQLWASMGGVLRLLRAGDEMGVVDSTLHIRIRERGEMIDQLCASCKDKRSTSECKLRHRKWHEVAPARIIPSDKEQARRSGDNSRAISPEPGFDHSDAERATMLQDIRTRPFLMLMLISVPLLAVMIPLHILAWMAPEIPFSRALFLFFVQLSIYQIAILALVPAPLNLRWRSNLWLLYGVRSTALVMSGTGIGPFIAFDAKWGFFCLFIGGLLLMALMLARIVPNSIKQHNVEEHHHLDV